MANSYNKGRIYINTATGDTRQAVSTDKRIKIAYITFIPNAGNDQCVIKESSSGEIVFVLSAATAKDTLFLDFSAKPVVMDGLYVESLSSNAQAILYTTSEGSK